MSEISKAPAYPLLERETYLVASQTFQPIPILSLEQIDNETVIPLLVDLPFLLSSHLGRQCL